MPIQTVLYGLWPQRYLRWCRRRYGDAFGLRIAGLGASVVLADPAAIRDAFALRPVDVRTDGTLLEPFLGVRSVLVLDGDAHSRQRRLLSRAFRPDRLRIYGASIESATIGDMHSWPVGEAFALHPHLQAITLEVILGVVLGIREPDRIEALRSSLRPFLAGAGSLLVLNPAFRVSLGGHSPWARFDHHRARVRQVLLEEIASRRAVPARCEGSDMMSILLSAHEADPLGDEELVDNLLTMVLAGHDTTATALTWTFDLVLHHSSVLRRLKADLAEGASDYLDAVIKESLRLRPVVSDTGRKLAHDTNLGGIGFSAGTSVMPSILLAHLRADSYPDPDEFRPERFLEGSPEPLIWLPFGGGFRRCLGAGFATLEMQVMLRTILTRCDLTPASSRMERQKRRAVTLTPRHATRVVMTRPHDDQMASTEHSI